MVMIKPLREERFGPTQSVVSRCVEAGNAGVGEVVGSCLCMLSAKLIDHFQNPRNVGELAPPAHVVEVMNPACGDILRLSVRWESDRVAEVRFKVRGCTASIGVGSALAEWMEGRSRSELAALKSADAEALVDELIPESKHAAVLAVDALKALLRQR